MRFAKDGVPVIAAVLILALILATAGWIMSNMISWFFYLLAVGMSGFTLFFFRDPERAIPQMDALLAPADGKIISVEKVRETTCLNDNAIQISIFLSLWNVHVNRYPVTGQVEHVSYQPGKYLVAWHPKSSELNERAEFCIKHPSGLRVFYRQITGFVARRIVFDTRAGDHVTAGDRFGIMKFGSRMDLLLPVDLEILINKGDHVIGGETIITRLK